MDVAKVELHGRARWCLFLSKWEATAFTVVAGGKKDPDDEQAVRFVIGERSVVWATDATQLLTAEPNVHGKPPSKERHVYGHSLKAVAAKTRVSHWLVIPLDGNDPVLISKVLVKDGMTLDVLDDTENLPELLDVPGNVTTWGLAHLEHVEQLSARQGDPAAGWWLTARFASTFAAVAKATERVEAWWVGPVADGGRGRSPMVVTVPDDVEHTMWRVLAMPIVGPAPK